MELFSQNTDFQFFGKSVQGASHKNKQKPNQDALSISFENGDNFSLILSVADGHGGSAYYRSEIGSRLAVESAISVCKTFLERNARNFIESNFDTENIKNMLCKDIVDEWRDRVHQDSQKQKESDQKLHIEEIISENISQETEEIRSPSKNNDRDEITPYGSTLLITILSKSFMLFLQIGDGDILTVSSEGTVSRPLPRDERLMFNETTSLCLTNAWKDFFVAVRPSNEGFPALILASTDGYSNSFINDTDYEKVAKDILNIICSNENGIEYGVKAVEDRLETWLNRTSEQGSGDDITAGIICNIKEIQKYNEFKELMKDSEDFGWDHESEGQIFGVFY